jgi:hypothetical protein
VHLQNIALHIEYTHSMQWEPFRNIFTKTSADFAATSIPEIGELTHTLTHNDETLPKLILTAITQL